MKGFSNTTKSRLDTTNIAGTIKPAAIKKLISGLRVSWIDITA
jgi:hypothetical protein